MTLKKCQSGEPTQNKNNITFSKIAGHFRTIHTHRKWVRYFCFQMGLYKQGILHDLSKYSPTEFWESVKYFSGTSSPINAAKRDKGYSDAWFHHRGRNKHHWAFWMDEFSFGGIPVPMPHKYVLELIADYLGANAAYSGIKSKKELTADFYKKEYEWWLKDKDNQIMDPITKDWVEHYLSLFAKKGNLSIATKTYRKIGRFVDEFHYESECSKQVAAIQEKILSA